MSNGMIILSISTMLAISIIAIVFILPKSRKIILKAFKETFIIMLFATFSLIIMVVLTTSMIMVMTLFDTTTEKRVNIIEDEKEIVSLNYNQEVSGSMNGFVLGVGAVNGNINTDNYFYFYSKENNRYKLEKINTEQVLIEETNDVKPKIVYRKFEEVKDVTETPTKIGKKLGLKEEKEENIKLDTVSNRAMGYYKGSSKDETVLYIPVGSIVENFNPNIE